jgi:hypothetical protein
VFGALAGAQGRDFVVGSRVGLRIASTIGVFFLVDPGGADPIFDNILAQDEKREMSDMVPLQIFASIRKPPA